MSPSVTQLKSPPFSVEFRQYRIVSFQKLLQLTLVDLDWLAKEALADSAKLCIRSD